MTEQTESTDLETTPSASGSAEAALLCVGDRVLIRKPKTVDGWHQYVWTHDMDEYDGCVSSVRSALPKGEDETIQSYDLNIDGGKFGWLEAWLTKLDAS